jgi:hypothetical protein
MMRALAIAFVVLVYAGVVSAAPAPVPEPVKMPDFLQRCKTDWEFCKVRIQAQMTAMHAGREACIPNDVKRDEAAVRIAHVLEAVQEEDASIFEAGEYRLFVGQVIALIWPCGVVS